MEAEERTNLFSLREVANGKEKVEERVDRNEEGVHLLAESVVDSRFVEQASQLADKERARDLVALCLIHEELVEAVDNFSFDDAEVVVEVVLQQVGVRKSSGPRRSGRTSPTIMEYKTCTAELRRSSWCERQRERTSSTRPGTNWIWYPPIRCVDPDCSSPLRSSGHPIASQRRMRILAPSPRRSPAIRHTARLHDRN